MCPPPYEPCLGMLCGEPCKLCAPSDPGCVEPPEPLACDGFGSCLSQEKLMCPPPYEPCLGKACGKECTLCPPADPGCVEPPGVKLCDDFGQCLPDMIGCAEPVDGGMGP